MVVRHPCKVQPADEVVDAEGLHKASDLSNAILWIPDNEAVIAKRVERHRGLILRANEGMLPTATVFITIIDHDILLGQLPCALAGVCNDDLARERVGHVRRVLSGS